jgi:hypothetical protein
LLWEVLTYGAAQDAGIFSSFRSKYSPQLLVLKHIPVFTRQCETPICTCRNRNCEDYASFVDIMLFG